MPVFFNPAAALTANRMPYALGGGRLADSLLTYNPASGSVSVSGAGARAFFDDTAFAASALPEDVLTLQASNAVDRGWPDTGPSILFKARWSGGPTIYELARISSSGHSNYGGGLRFWCHPAAGSGSPMFVAGSFHHSGNFLLGNNSDLSNGRAQLATHTTAAGGLGFFDNSLFRSGANRLASNATNFDCVNLNVSVNAQVAGTLLATQLASTVNCNVGGDYRVAGTPVVGARRLGWEMNTGATARINFNPATVSLENLAKTVSALIQDLHATSSGHGLIGS